jgi:D-alanyl-D-alanine carboxypeptidase (penicillin-binding protein 5/6)
VGTTKSSLRRATYAKFFCLLVLLLIQQGPTVPMQWQIQLGKPLLLQKNIELQKTVTVPVPIQYSKQVPELTAESYIVYDVQTPSILTMKNERRRLFPASTTKMMTALVAMENYSLDTIVTITQEDDALGSSMNLHAGEQMTVANLLYGTLVKSGNDAAYALASAHPQGYNGFVLAMNARAQSLGMTSTEYGNVSGVEQGDQSNITTVRDTALLAAEGMKNPLFRQIVQTKRIVIADVSGKSKHDLTSTNELLGAVDGVIGIKTGWTDAAGECLVTYTSRNNHDVITVMLNSADRFGETRQLIDWAFTNFEWKTAELPQ